MRKTDGSHSLGGTGRSNRGASQASQGPSERYSRLSSRISRMSNVGKRKGDLVDTRRVLDDDGNDVTPKDLLAAPEGGVGPAHDSGRESPASRHSSQSIDSKASRGPGAHGMMALDDAGQEEEPEAEDGGSQRVSEVGDGDGAEPRPGEMLNEGDLDLLVAVTLSETPTRMMLDLRPVVVNSDGPEAGAVREANERYEQVLESKRTSDRYVSSEAQTVNGLARSQHSQSQAMVQSSTDAQVFSYDIEDAFAAEAKVGDSDEDEDLPGDGAGPMPLVSKTTEVPEADDRAAGRGRRTARGSMMTAGTNSMMGSVANLGSMFGSTMSMMGKAVAGRKGSQKFTTLTFDTGDPEVTLDSLPQVHDALQLMEAAVSQGLYSDRLLQFRGVQRSARTGLPVNSTDLAASMFGAAAPPLRRADESGSVAGTDDGRSNTSRQSSLRGRRNTLDSPSESGFTREEKAAVSMDHLWDYSCPLFEGKNVSSIAWNKARPDLLAVGYGSFSFTYKTEKFSAKPPDQEEGASAGFVALWSLKSPEWPLFWFETPCGVTSIDWSGHYPSILAVGLYDGSIGIYDTRDKDTEPIMKADFDTGQHTDPVWKVKWVDFGDRGETLVSISTDSKVVRWTTSKGLERTLLMTLKKQANPFRQSTGKEPEAFISRNASGMCFDFNIRDVSVYVTSTEEGTLHKCSTSYSEQYLESYWGHMGPVYKVQYSPFAPGVFISASADWTLRLWREGKQEPLLTLHSGVDSAGHAINDVSWCPYNATTLASVTQDGAVELWDLDYSVLAPRQKHQPFPGIAMNCVSFCESSPVLACGAASGKVHLFRLSGLANRRSDDPTKEAERLETVLMKNIRKARERKGQVEGH